MRKEIDRVLGNSLRCILPSYWWKRLLGKMADKIESAEESAAAASRIAMLAGREASDKQPQLVSGSNIKTINNQSILGSGNITVSTDRMEKYKTKEELDAVGITDGGEIAAVVDDVLVEKSFTECYQPTSAEINANKYNAKFTKVDGLVLNPDFNPNLISSNYGKLSVMLYSDGKSKGYYKGYPSHLEIRCDYDRRIICWEYDDISNSGHTLYDSSGFNASNIDSVNNILREGDFRFSYFVVTYRGNVSDGGYTYYYSYQSNFPSDATAMIDNMVKMLFADTQNADIYVRSSKWVRLLKEGDVTGGGADITIDSELSDTSTNAIQNKVVANALNEKADASSLEESNQEIMGVIEAVSLDIGEMIGAANLSINELYNTKQDKIADLETIRSGAAKGATALQSVPSEYITESELNAKSYATTSQLSGKQDTITDLATIRSGAALGATAVQPIVEDDGVYLGDVIGIVAPNDEYYYLPNSAPDDPAHTFAMLSDLQNAGGVSQEDFDALYDGVIEAEEVTAAALNDLNNRLGKLAENVQGETVTKEEFETAVNNLNESLSGKADAQTTSEALTALSGQVETLSGQVETAVTSEQLSSAVDNVNNTILENEEITAAALVDLNTKITDILERLNNAGL